MTGLPPNWSRVPLLDISSVPEQRVPSNSERFRYIDISSIDRERKVIQETQELTGKNAPSRARKVVRTGDVLVSMTRPNLNAVALVPPELDGHIASTGFDVLRPKGVDPRWLYYLVRSQAFVDEMSSLVQGALYPAVRSKDVRAFMAPLAPLAEQKRIADKLDRLLAAVDTCKARLDTIPAILKRFRQSVLAAATSGGLTEEWRAASTDQKSARIMLAEIANLRKTQSHRGRSIKSDEEIQFPNRGLPESWTWCRVGDIADVQLGGTPSRKQSEYWGGDVPWVSSGEVSNCRIGSTREAITPAGLENSNAKVYPRGTVLIAMIGEGKTRGQAAILEIEAATNQNCAGLLLQTSKIEPEYVWYWALGEYERNRNVGRGGNQPALNSARVRALPLPLPPREEQQEIVRRVRSVLLRADQLESKVEAIRSSTEMLTQTVLARAFRGELLLRVTQPHTSRAEIFKCWENLEHAGYEEMESSR